MLETIAHAKCSSASLGTADGFAVRMNGFGAAGAGAIRSTAAHG